MERTAGQGKPQPTDWPDLVAAVAEFGGRRAIPGFGTSLGIPRDPIWLEACALRPDLVARYLDCTLAGIPGTIGPGGPGNLPGMPNSPGRPPPGASGLPPAPGSKP